MRFIPVSIAIWYLPTTPRLTARSPYASANSEV